MLPGPGRYEERWRLTHLAIPLFGVVFLLFGLTIHFWPFILFGGVSVLLYILTITIYRIAFRADSAGITLGANLMGFKFYAVHIPWPDIETIILYTIRERPTLPRRGKVD